MNVKLVVFNAGIQIVGEVMQDEENKKLVIIKPVSLVFIGPEPGKPQEQGRVSMGFSPFLQYTDEWKTGMPFSISDVMTVTTPNTELLNAYNTQYGSGIVLTGGLVK
jgi:hypothetical protein